VFCGACGADLRTVAPPPVAQQPVAPPVAPLQPPPLPSQRVAPPQAAAPPPQAKGGLSSGAIAGIVAGVLVVVALLGVGALFVLRGMSGSGPPVVVSTPTPPLSTPPAAAAPTTSVDASADAGAETSPEAPSEEIVTDAEARDVVKKFMGLRLAMDVAGSKKLCTKNMLNGEDTKPLVNDKYWRPDSYKIVKTTPDLMYIHVAIMGVWPSGNEPSIFSVFRDPETGKVLIDGMLDPTNVPELWK
jgi:hypothetical protein